MKKENVFGVLALSMMITSCATIFSGSTKIVRFSSNPSSAAIFIDEIEVGKTPFEMLLTRMDEHSVEMKLDGYQTYHTRLTKTLNPWCIANVFIGGVIGLIVDASTGAMYDLSPGIINAEMNNGTDIQPVVNEQSITTKVERTKDQLNIGDNVKFYNYSFNDYIDGVVKEIKDKSILIEYKSFGKMKTVEISKSDIKRI